MTDVRMIPEIINRYDYLLYPANPVWLRCAMKKDLSYCRCLDKIELNIAALIVAKKIYGNDKTLVNVEIIEDDPYFVKVYDSGYDKELAGYKNCCKIERIELLNYPRSYPNNYDALGERIAVLMSPYSATIMYSAFCLFKCNRDLSVKRNSIVSYYFCIDADAFIKYILVLEDCICNGNKHIKYWPLHFELINTVLKIYAGREQINLAMPDVFDVFDDQFFQTNYDCVDCSQQFKENLRRLEGEDKPGFSQLSLTKDSIITNLTKIKEHINKSAPNSRFDEVFLNMFRSLECIARKQRRHNEKSINQQLSAFSNSIKNGNK